VAVGELMNGRQHEHYTAASAHLCCATPQARALARKKGKKARACKLLVPIARECYYMYDVVRPSRGPRLAIFGQTCNHFSPQYNSETAGLLTTKSGMALGIHVKNLAHVMRPRPSASDARTARGLWKLLLLQLALTVNESVG
jgi:hypothetical protein